MRTTTSNRRLAPIALAVLAAACGGGGGGGGGDSNTGTGPPPTSVSLTGTAAKGLMANADVSVYAVKADGTADTSAALARTTTSSKVWSISEADDSLVSPGVEGPSASPPVAKTRGA